MTRRAHGRMPPVPAGYRATFGIRRREEAIKFIKDTFERHLAAALKLERVSAPVAVLASTGLNDHLNGVEQSRLCMLFLRCAHVGEVQAGIWPEGLRNAYRRKGVVLL